MVLECKAVIRLEYYLVMLDRRLRGLHLLCRLLSMSLWISVFIENWEWPDGLGGWKRILQDGWPTEGPLLAGDGPCWLAVLDPDQRFRGLAENICSVIEIRLLSVGLIYKSLRRFELIVLQGLLLHIECNWLDRSSFGESRFLKFWLTLLLLLQLGPCSLGLLRINRIEVNR